MNWVEADLPPASFTVPEDFHLEPDRSLYDLEVRDGDAPIGQIYLDLAMVRSAYILTLADDQRVINVQPQTVEA